MLERAVRVPGTSSRRRRCEERCRRSDHEKPPVRRHVPRPVSTEQVSEVSGREQEFGIPRAECGLPLHRHAHHVPRRRPTKEQLLPVGSPHGVTRPRLGRFAICRHPHSETGERRPRVGLILVFSLGLCRRVNGQCPKRGATSIVSTKWKTHSPPTRLPLRRRRPCNRPCATGWRGGRSR